MSNQVLVTSVKGFKVGDSVTLQMADGSQFVTTITAISSRDANGYYTVTFANALPGPILTGSKMVKNGKGGGHTRPPLPLPPPPPPPPDPPGLTPANFTPLGNQLPDRDVVAGETLTVGGIAGVVYAVAATNGPWSKNGGAFTTAAGTALTGDTVGLGVHTSAAFDTLVTASLNVGGSVATLTARTIIDPIATLTPANWPQISDAPLNTPTVSTTPIMIGNAPVPVAVVPGAGMAISKNSGPYLATAQTAVTGDSLNAQITSSGANDTLVTRTATIDGITASFAVRTVATLGPVTLTPSDWTTLGNQLPSAVVTSLEVITLGNAPIAVPVTPLAGLLISKNAGGYSGLATTGVTGDTFRARLTTSAAFDTLVSLDCDFDGVLATFAARTIADPGPPVLTPADWTPLANQALDSDVTGDLITVSNAPVAVTVTPGAGLSLSKNGGGYSAAATTTINGDTFRPKLHTSTAYNTQVSKDADFGGVLATFAATTLAAPAGTAGLFGIKTRSGYGADANAPAGAITGVGAADWTDTAGSTAPSGTYGAYKAFSKPAGQAYSLTYAGALPYTITMVAATAHIAANAADTASSFQLRNMLALTVGSPGALIAGDTLIGRDGFVNPTGALWSFGPAPGAVTVRSENPDHTTDANGNPSRGGGHQIGALSASTSTDTLVPVAFEDVDFFANTNATRANFLGHRSTTGYGLIARRCRFENDPVVTLPYLQNGFDCRGGISEYNYFKRLRRGMTGGRLLGDAQTVIRWNVFEDMSSDAMTLSGQNLLVEYNFGFDFLFESGEHPDFCQHLGALTQTYTNFGLIRRNIGVRNASPGIADAQGIFLSDTPAPYWIQGATIEQNIINLTAANGIVLTRFDGAVVRFNTVIMPLDPYGTGVTPTAVPTIDCDTSINCSVSYSVANGFTLGTNTGTGNVTLAKTQAAYQAAFHAPLFGANPGIVRRDVALAAYAAKLNGTLHLGGGLYAGALFPIPAGYATPPWNDGSAYNPGNSVWLADHAPAS